MKFWDNPATKAMTLWTVAVAAVILFALLIRCTPDPVAPTSTPCLPDIIELENESANCNEAQLKVDVLLRYSSTCRAIFGDAGFNVCAKVARKDGGRD